MVDTKKTPNLSLLTAALLNMCSFTSFYLVVLLLSIFPYSLLSLLFFLTASCPLGKIFLDPRQAGTEMWVCLESDRSMLAAKKSQQSLCSNGPKMNTASFLARLKGKNKVQTPTAVPKISLLWLSRLVAPADDKIHRWTDVGSYSKSWSFDWTWGGLERKNSAGLMLLFLIFFF